MSLAEPYDPAHGVAVPVLHVCVTCRAGLQRVEGPVQGTILHDRLTELADAALPDEALPVRLEAVECLAVCDSGCAAAIAAPGKWGYLLGGLDPAMAEDLLVFARAYVAARTGTVMPSKRPASLANMILGRIPIPPSAETRSPWTRSP